MKKRCRDCGKIKPIEEFHVDKEKSDGHRGRCAKCRNVILAEWRQTPAGLKCDERKNANVMARSLTDREFAQRRRDIVNKSSDRPEYRERLREKAQSEEGRFKKKATRAVETAIKNGTLKRPFKCSACGVKPGFDKRGRSKVRAIHIHGHDVANHLNVKFMCSRCVEAWKKTKVVKNAD